MRATRLIVKSRLLNIVRDPVLAAGIAGSATLSYVALFALGGRQPEYWARVSFVFIPLLLIFMATARQNSAESQQERRLFETLPIRNKDLEFALSAGGGIELLAYVLLVAPQALFIAVRAPSLAGLALQALLTGCILTLLVAILARLLPRQGDTRTTSGAAIVFGVGFLFAVLATIYHGELLIFGWLLAAVPAGAAIYAAGAVVDIVAAVLPAFGVLLAWAALLWTRTIGVGRAARYSVNIVSAVSIIACAFVTAASIESTGSNAPRILASEFAFDIVDEDGKRVERHTNLPMHEPTRISVHILAGQSRGGAGHISLEAPHLSVAPLLAETPPGQDSIRIPFIVTPRPSDALVDQQHILVVTWAHDGVIQRGATLVESEDGAFKPGVLGMILLPLTYVAVVLFARRR